MHPARLFIELGSVVFVTVVCPGFFGVGLLDLVPLDLEGEGGMGRRGYPPEFVGTCWTWLRRGGRSLISRVISGSAPNDLHLVTSAPQATVASGGDGQGWHRGRTTDPDTGAAQQPGHHPRSVIGRALLFAIP